MTLERFFLREHPEGATTVSCNLWDIAREHQDLTKVYFLKVYWWGVDWTQTSSQQSLPNNRCCLMLGFNWTWTYTLPPYLSNTPVAYISDVWVDFTFPPRHRHLLHIARSSFTTWHFIHAKGVSLSKIAHIFDENRAGRATEWIQGGHLNMSWQLGWWISVIIDEGEIQ